MIVLHHLVDIECLSSSTRTSRSSTCRSRRWRRAVTKSGCNRRSCSSGTSPRFQSPPTTKRITLTSTATRTRPKFGPATNSPYASATRQSNIQNTTSPVPFSSPIHPTSTNSRPSDSTKSKARLKDHSSGRAQSETASPLLWARSSSCSRTSPPQAISQCSVNRPHPS